MAATETTRWEIAKHLDSETKIAAYLDAVTEDGDPTLIATAADDVVAARLRMAGRHGKPGSPHQGGFRPSTSRRRG